MIFTGWKRVVPVSMLVLPLLLGLSSQAMGQDQAKASQASQAQAKPEDKAKQAEAEGVVRTKEEVTVTGTLIPRKDLTSLSPVTVVEPEEITYHGTGRVVGTTIAPRGASVAARNNRSSLVSRRVTRRWSLCRQPTSGRPVETAHRPPPS